MLAVIPLTVVLSLTLFFVVYAQQPKTNNPQEAQATQQPEPKEGDVIYLGDGFYAKLEISHDRRVVLIKFPEQYLPVDKFGSGVIVALMKLFPTEFNEHVLPEVKGKGTLEEFGDYAYIDTTGISKYRIAVFPLKFSREKPDLMGIYVTLLAIPENER
jgi:hypothetical protein